MITIDLKHAYLHVPMSLEASMWLGFMWRNQNYRQLTLPFGLATAPYVFTMLIRKVIAYLRLNYIVMAYLDDVGLIAHTE
jgi:hypothetical protein